MLTFRCIYTSQHNNTIYNYKIVSIRSKLVYLCYSIKIGQEEHVRSCFSFSRKNMLYNRFMLPNIIPPPPPPPPPYQSLTIPKYPHVFSIAFYTDHNSVIAWNFAIEFTNSFKFLFTNSHLKNILKEANEFRIFAPIITHDKSSMFI